MPGKVRLRHVSTAQPRHEENAGQAWESWVPPTRGAAHVEAGPNPFRVLLTL